MAVSGCPSALVSFRRTMMMTSAQHTSLVSMAAAAATRRAEQVDSETYASALSMYAR